MCIRFASFQNGKIMLFQSKLLGRAYGSGICGISGETEAAKIACFGLHALQHRGGESTGLVSSDGNKTWTLKARGLPFEVFTEENTYALEGRLAVGQVSGTDSTVHTLPFTATHRNRTISVVHDGSFTNYETLRDELELKGAVFHTESHSEAVVHVLVRLDKTELAAALRETFSKIEGSFALLLLINSTLIAIRDPQGTRPLHLGRLQGGGYVVVSETCALDLVEAEYLREIEPGEILLIDSDGLRSVYLDKKDTRFCILEQIHFARPDSNVFGASVYKSRKRMGKALADEFRITADLVMPFSDSGTYAALGYAQATGLPFELGLIPNHGTGRIPERSKHLHDTEARMEFSMIRSFISGKRIIVVENSIFSIAIMLRKIGALREAGVKEIHLLVSSPEIFFSCVFDRPFRQRNPSLAVEKFIDENRQKLSLNTLHFLSHEGLLKAVSHDTDNFYCKACMELQS